MTRISMFVATALTVGLLQTAPARADVVVLVGGETIEGIVRETKTQVIVELDVGTLTLDRESVKEIRKSHTKLDELRTRRQKLRFNDVAGLYDLAKWALEQGLTTQAHVISQEILGLDENHEGARRMLGFEKHDGLWLTEDERMKATGHVRYQGAWIKAEDAARLEGERKQQADERAKEDRLASMERSVLEAQREAAEAKTEAERARQEAESARENQWWRAGGNGYWPFNPYPRVYPNVYPTAGSIPPPKRKPSAAPAPPSPPPAAQGATQKTRP